MTLSLGILTDEHCIVVTDRRITSGARVLDDETDKTFSLCCLDGRFAVSFAGLAIAGSFHTHDWLMSACANLGPPTFQINEIAVGLTHRLTKEFQTNPTLRRVKPEDRRLSVLIVGYRHLDSDYGLLGLISNWQNPHKQVHSPLALDEFEIFRGLRKVGGPSNVAAIGNHNGLLPSIVDRLRSNGHEVGARALTNRLVHAVRKAAEHPISQNVIGKQITSLMIPARRDLPIRPDYHVAVPTMSLVGPANVIVDPRGSVAFSGMTVTPMGSDARPMSVPVVRRSRLCPCGSQKKYKHCHGTIEPELDIPTDDGLG